MKDRIATYVAHPARPGGAAPRRETQMVAKTQGGKHGVLVDTVLGYNTAWNPALAKAFKIAELTTPARQGAFIAQCFHESAGFTRLEENLNYTAERLTEVWPGRFAAKDTKGNVTPNRLALLCAKNPEKLANTVYSNRMGNGPEASGDGWRYHGRGWIMLTFRNNYAQMSEITGDDYVNRPELVALPDGAASAAAAFWKANGLNAYADKGNYKNLSERVNGGSIGMEERLRLTTVAVKAYTELAAISDPLSIYLA